MAEESTASQGMNKDTAPFFLFIVVFFVFLPTIVLADVSVDDLYESALKNYKNGYYEEALREFSLVLLERPDDQQARFYINEIRQKDIPARHERIDKVLDEAQQRVEAVISSRGFSIERQLNVYELSEERENQSAD